MNFPKMLNHTLYLCYFGYREPLVHTQVIAYLREIARDGTRVSLLTFEPDFAAKWTAEQIAEEKARQKEFGVEWHCLPYHKSPSVPATLYDIAAGVRFARKMIKTEGVNILHARTHVPAMMATLAKKLSGSRVKILFDIRGFMPEEYVDGGNWKKDSAVYRNVKKIEKSLLKNADAFVVLTEKARDILFPESKETGADKFGRPVEVIPCCVDLQKFDTANETSRREIRAQYNLENRRVIVYVGSLGTWYMADEMADLMQAARENDPSVFALVLTQSAPEIMSERLKSRGFSDADFLVKKVPHSEIPKYLSASDAALSFIKACYSKLSSSPTKIAEYLASGVPVITNRGVGDVAEQIETDAVGAVVEDFSRESYTKALREITDLSVNSDIKRRCRQSAGERFDLTNIGGKKYRAVYRRLLGKK